MEALVDRLKMMVKVFRRECHRVLQSERTTIHGADSMLLVLQLAMAEVNKQVIKFIQTAFIHSIQLCASWSANKTSSKYS